MPSAPVIRGFPSVILSGLPYQSITFENLKFISSNKSLNFIDYLAAATTTRIAIMKSLIDLDEANYAYFEKNLGDKIN